MGKTQRIFIAGLFFSKRESRQIPSQTASAASSLHFRFLFTFHKVTHGLLFKGNWTHNYRRAPEKKGRGKERSDTSKAAIKIFPLVVGRTMGCIQYRRCSWFVLLAIKKGWTAQN